jgi:succinate dehydrogenase hydrophobic anchor subunit
VVIEDYVRDELKRFAAICAVNGLAVLLWLAASLSVLRIAL